MTFKRKSARKLASLSALGAGALVLGAGTADAGVIYSGTVGAKVGFDTGFNANYTSPALGAGGPSFKFSRGTLNGAYNTHLRKMLFNQAGGINFAFNGSALQVFSAGALWSSRVGSADHGRVATRDYGLNAFSHTIIGNHSFTNKYALVTFGPSFSLYGWIQLSLQINDVGGGSGANGPNLTIVDFAYEDSGQKLAAGALTPFVPPPPSGTPEPATLATTGLAALILGAAGVRKWRPNAGSK
jgi:hypothetical protein